MAILVEGLRKTMHRAPKTIGPALALSLHLAMHFELSGPVNIYFNFLHSMNNVKSIEFKIIYRCEAFINRFVYIPWY